MEEQAKELNALDCGIVHKGELYASSGCTYCSKCDLKNIFKKCPISHYLERGELINEPYCPGCLTKFE